MYLTDQKISVVQEFTLDALENIQEYLKCSHISLCTREICKSYSLLMLNVVWDYITTEPKTLEDMDLNSEDLKVEFLELSKLFFAKRQKDKKNPFAKNTEYIGEERNINILKFIVCVCCNLALRAFFHSNHTEYVYDCLLKNYAKCVKEVLTIENFSDVSTPLLTLEEVLNKFLYSKKEIC